MSALSRWVPVTRLWCQPRFYIGETYSKFDELCIRSRQFLRSIFRRSKKTEINLNTTTAIRVATPTQIRESLLSQFIRRCSNDSAASRIGRIPHWRAFNVGGTTFLGLTGLVLVQKPSFITDEEESFVSCANIWSTSVGPFVAAHYASKQVDLDSVSENDSPVLNREETPTLADLEIGEPLAKGCNALVYSARWRPQSAESGNNNRRFGGTTLDTIVEEVSLNHMRDVNDDQVKFFGGDLDARTGSVNVADFVPHVAALKPYDRIVKRVFNYHAASNAFDIERAFHAECRPIELRCGDRPHPNIADIEAKMAARVVPLPGERQLCRAALPPRLCASGGFGRNMTMYLVMRRYNGTLRQYLDFCARQERSLHQSINDDVDGNHDDVSSVHDGRVSEFPTSLMRQTGLEQVRQTGLEDLNVTSSVTSSSSSVVVLSEEEFYDDWSFLSTGNDFVPLEQSTDRLLMADDDSNGASSGIEVLTDVERDFDEIISQVSTVPLLTSSVNGTFPAMEDDNSDSNREALVVSPEVDPEPEVIAQPEVEMTSRRSHACNNSALDADTLSLVMLTQLMDSVAFLYANDVAHRDLKSDNVLVDLSHGIDRPILKLSDFGCSVRGLRIPYQTEQVSRGGNPALMPPEITNAVPHYLGELDYRRSDLWTAATLAYEIYGTENPFWRRLSPETYDLDQLPDLPQGVPQPVRFLIRTCLNPDPSKRPDPRLAAAICHVTLALLTLPPILSLPARMTSRSVLKWLSFVMADTMLRLKADADWLLLRMRIMMFTTLPFSLVVQAALYVQSNQ